MNAWDIGDGAIQVVPDLVISKMQSTHTTHISHIPATRRKFGTDTGSSPLILFCWERPFLRRKEGYSWCDAYCRSASCICYPYSNINDLRRAFWSNSIVTRVFETFIVSCINIPTTELKASFRNYHQGHTKQIYSEESNEKDKRRHRW